ncbi:MAG: LysM peptidoglycan-binding domain-containing protein [Planctomycetes bacterium]|nr:LysM peptidoglycan-binding domain-containing protein [Planctomycetota bacterium]
MKAFFCLKRVLFLAAVVASFLPGSATAWPRGDKGKDSREEPVNVPHVNHTVQPGETLFSIAEKYYGNGYEWSRLQEYNRWVDPKQLSVGSVIFVPEPRRGGASGSSKGRGFFEALFGSGERSPESGENTGRMTLDPAPARASWGLNPLSSLFSDLGSIQFLGIPFFRLIFLLASWFVGHMAVQGGLVWFCAHVAFVKDVNFKKALRSSAQLETLALVFVLIVSVTALLLIYVGTAPPGKPVLRELFSIAEEYVGTPTGLAVTGFLLVALYVFLGIRFIPQAFGAANAQGWAIVLMAILIPHLIFLYLVGHRLGFIG